MFFSINSTRTKSRKIEKKKKEEDMQDKKGARSGHHFVLVHGSGHGGWCWFKVLKLLKMAGHRASALDMGASGINSKSFEQVNTISDYSQPLMNFMEALPEEDKVILVGHSYGGLTISLAMEAFSHKILLAVFITAYMPHFISPPSTLMTQYFKTISVESVLDCQFTLSNNDSKIPTSVVFGPKYMANKLYKNCSQEDLALGKLLVRPFKMFFEDFSKESLLTEAKFGSVNRVFFVCEEDEVMDSEFQRLMMEKFPPKAVISINGGGHMVMLSKPTKLSKLLDEVSMNHSIYNTSIVI